jgi:hypothetical protein
MNAVNIQFQSERIVQSWFLALARTVQEKDLDSHMSLVSQRIKVYGMPSKGVIDYKEWKKRRRYEFENNELLSISHNGLRIISTTPRRINFNTTQVMLGKDGKMVELDKNIILEKEQDDNWRVVEENVNKWQVKKMDLSRLK